MSEVRIAVYVCHCGTNIADKVDVAGVREFARRLPGVEVARDYQYMCADPGQELLRSDIRERGINRVVVASCSPRMHEATFRQVLESAGLNGYLFEMANIREHCSWVTEESELATHKARALVAAAVKRVRFHAPLEERYVEVNQKALVVGGGIAGIEAALKIARAGKKVWLVERGPSIGGKMAGLDKTFPTLDCSACILTPKMVEAAQHPKITLLSYSEVEGVDGYVGNFQVTVRRKARYVREEDCTGCGTCYQKCPKKVPSEFDGGLSHRKAIYVPFPQAVPNVPVIDRSNCIRFQTGRCGACEKFCPRDAVDFEQEDEFLTLEVGAVIVATGYETFQPQEAPQWGWGRYENVLTARQLERLVNASGPTGGKVLLRRDGEFTDEVPKSVAVLHCIGSRDENYYPYCSRLCCMASLKLAHLIREKTGAQVYSFYIDIRSAGKGYEEFYTRVQAEGIQFIRGKGAEVLERDGQLYVHAEDTLLGAYREVPVDMVVLSTAVTPAPGAERVAQIFGIQRGQDGFFLESHPKLEPLKTATEGIYIVGCCQGPKDIPDSVAQGAGGAAEVLSLLTAGRVQISPVVAEIDAEACSGCKVCVPLCPYSAIKYDEERGACGVNEALCKGCGTCVASCPSGALSCRHFTDEQIYAQIEEVSSL